MSGVKFECLAGAPLDRDQEEYQDVVVPKELRQRYQLKKKYRVKTNGIMVTLGMDLYHKFPTEITQDPCGLDVARSKITGKNFIFSATTGEGAEAGLVLD